MNLFIQNTIIYTLIILLCACTQHPTTKITMTSPKEGTIQVFDDWYLYQNHATCYIASYPISSSGNYTQRGSNYILITYNPITQENEISIIGGLKYDSNATTTLAIDSMSFILINHDYRAWSIGEDDLIMQHLLKNPPILVVFNFFEDNLNAIDKYSTNGLLLALKTLNNTCNRHSD